MVRYIDEYRQELEKHSDNKGSSVRFLLTGKWQTGKKLLVSIVKEPLLGISERYKKICLNPKIGNQWKQLMVEQGLINEVSIATSKGRLKLLELTDKGREKLKDFGFEVSTSFRHGGIEHLYWLKQVKKKLVDAGYDVEEESPIGNGEAVDLVIVGKGKKIAVEIETGKSDAVHNIRKCLKAGFDGVVSVATNKDALKRIKSGLDQFQRDEIEKVRVRGVWRL